MPPAQGPAVPSAVPGLTLVPTAIDSIPGFESDRLVEALPALHLSCDRFLALPESRTIGPGALAGTVADWHPICEGFAALPAADEGAFRAFMSENLVAFRVVDGKEGAADKGLFTGYYESELDGSLTPSGPASVPLYSPPDDMVMADLGLFESDLQGQKISGRLADGRLVPYFSRAEIDDGALAGRGLELLWIDDPVDAFFLHVQGSGRVRLPDGGSLRVGYAGSNGLPFYAIGRHMLDKGIISRDQASMQGIRDWLRSHPAEGKAIMELNSRYIFFQPIEGPGPIGAQGVALTPERSLAVDTAFIPLGIPVFLDTTWPGSDRPLQRLMVAQDTGAAIQGVVRGDFFWGTGDAALAYAGKMKQPGSYYLFLPRSVAARLRAGS